MSLMMSSCCTLRLKRRKAPSIDSPSCTRTSANCAVTPSAGCGERHRSYARLRANLRRSRADMRRESGFRRNRPLVLSVLR